LVPTKTNNAYEFSRWIAKVAKIGKCEIWPKQRGYSGRRGKDYGNLVKLPLAYHNKTGRRSVFLDPMTFEPMEYVPFPGLVRLFEYPSEGFDLVPISRALNSYVNIFNIYGRFWTNSSSI
jgi:hypothetical protein